MSWSRSRGLEVRPLEVLEKWLETLLSLFARKFTLAFSSPAILHMPHASSGSPLIAITRAILRFHAFYCAWKPCLVASGLMRFLGSELTPN